MNKLFVIILASAILTGCGATPIKTVNTVTAVPVVPTIDVPPRPELYIHKLRPEDVKNPGLVAKYYKISLLQLLDYSTDLEEIIAAYNKIGVDLKTVDKLNKITADK